MADKLYYGSEDIMQLIVKYSFFAVLSISSNLLTQYCSFLIYDGLLSLYIAMFFGTIIGLLVKYVLDKKYIFYFKSKSKIDDGKKFLLYSIMGIVTTIIFWGTEMSFFYLFQFSGSQYLGGLIGLIIGYTVKYHLDKHFVFKVGV